MLDRELVRDRFNVLELIVVFRTTEPINSFMDTHLPAERHRLILVIIVICLNIYVPIALKELSWYGVICASFIVLPEVDHVTKLSLHHVHLVYSVHVIMTAQVHRRILEFVSILVLKA